MVREHTLQNETQPVD